MLGGSRCPQMSSCLTVFGLDSATRKMFYCLFYLSERWRHRLYGVILLCGGERIPPWNIHLSLTAKLSERTLSALQEQWKEIHNGWQENVGKSHIKTTQEEKPNQSFLPDGRKSETWKRQITKWTDSWGETQGIYVSLKVEREKSLFRAQEAQKMEEDEELRERRERKADYLCRLSHFWGRVSLQRLIQQNVSENTTASPPPFNLLRPRRTQRASHELQAEHLRTFKNV